MTGYLALAIVIAAAVALSLVTRPVWRRCRCGDRICNGCGRHR